MAFLSGAALNHLHLVLNDQSVPLTLLRARLTLRAAEACLVQAGRPERAPGLRDAVAFLQPGDSPGPAGEVYLSWRRAIERPVSVNALHRTLPDLEPEQIATWRDAGQGAPVARAAAVLQVVLADRPRDQTNALLLADATLAQVLGWSHVTPLLGRYLNALIYESQMRSFGWPAIARMPQRSWKRQGRSPICHVGPRDCGTLHPSCAPKERRRLWQYFWNQMLSRRRRAPHCDLIAQRGGFVTGWSSWVPCAS